MPHVRNDETWGCHCYSILKEHNFDDTRMLQSPRSGSNRRPPVYETGAASR